MRQNCRANDEISIRDENSFDAGERIGEERVARDRTADRRQMNGLTVNAHRSDGDVGTAEERRHRHSQRAPKERRDGRELGAYGAITGLDDHEPGIIGEHECLEMRLTPGMLDLITKRELTLLTALDSSLHESHSLLPSAMAPHPVQSGDQERRYHVRVVRCRQANRAETT